MATETLAKVDAIELAIARIDEAPVEEIAATLDAVKWFMEQAKRMKDACDEAMTARVKASGDKLMIGETLWVIKRAKKVKVRNIPSAVEAMFISVGGDFQTFCEMMTSQPLKPGACREQLNDEAKFEELFETSVDETAQPKLTPINTKFLK